MRGAGGAADVPPAPTIRPTPDTQPRPLFSVMITVYRRIDYLERAIRSVLAQDDGAMEIVVVHDGEDGALRDEIGRIVAQVGGGRVRLHAPPQPLGHPHVFNECVRRARGRSVHILHDDDWVKPGFYARLGEGIAAEPLLGAAFCRHTHTSGDRTTITRLERETPGIIADWLLRIGESCRVQFSSIVVRRAAYERLGGFRAEAGSAFDWDMWKRIATRYPVWFEPVVLAASTKDGDAETDRLKLSGQQVRDSLRSIELAEQFLPNAVSAEVTRRAKRFYASYRLDLAKRLLDAGNVAAFRANVAAALAADPSAEAALQLLASITHE